MEHHYQICVREAWDSADWHESQNPQETCIQNLLALCYFLPSQSWDSSLGTPGTSPSSCLLSPVVF